MNNQLNVIPHYLKASNPDELRQAMLAAQHESGITFNFFDIGKQGKDWFAWYLKDATLEIKKSVSRDLKGE